MNLHRKNSAPVIECEVDRERESDHAAAPPRAVDVPSAPTVAWEHEIVRMPRFAALRVPNFRLFWAGNLISLIGSLAQNAALGWLVRLLSDDPRLVTAVTACITGPNLLLTLYAGVLADRVDKRRVLMLVNGVQALLALVLAYLVWAGQIQVWQVLLLALLSGVVGAFDIPVRQSFNVEMVGGKELLPSAIALNSTAFNAARVIGPAAGGFLLYQIGADGCFLVNAISFGALIGALALQKLEPHRPTPRAFNAREFWRGVLFVRRTPVLWLILLLVSVVSVFAISFGSMMPIFAKDVFHTGEVGYAMLMVFNGLGALAAAVSLAASRHMKYKGKRLLLGAFLCCLSIVGFASSPNLPIAYFFLLLAGWFLLTFLMTANTLVQTLPPNYLRGRVFSLYSLSLVGMMPIGALLLGFLAHQIGPRLTVQLCALFAAAFTIFIFARYPVLWKLR